MKRIYYNGEVPLDAALYAAHAIDCRLNSDKLNEILLLHTLHKGGLIDTDGMPLYQFQIMLEAFNEAHELAAQIIEKAHENDSHDE